MGRDLLGECTLWALYPKQHRALNSPPLKRQSDALRADADSGKPVSVASKPTPEDTGPSLTRQEICLRVYRYLQQPLALLGAREMTEATMVMLPLDSIGAGRSRTDNLPDKADSNREIRVQDIFQCTLRNV